MAVNQYRADDVSFITKHILHHHSLEIVGMRRVGINNLLRHFFLQHTFGESDRQMYIFIDLNNLVEREAFPFWQLTLKRISDAVRDVVTDKIIRKNITSHFESAIQYQNLQVTYDGVRESLQELVRAGIEPVIFFNRYDRVVNMMNDAFIDNIRGLYDAADHKLSCVFTSYRPLSDFYGKKLPFDQLYTHYVLPLSEEDALIHMSEYEKKYGMKFTDEIRRIIYGLSGGHFQYLRLLMDILRETQAAPDQLQDASMKDERITLLSEELWESLHADEKKAVSNIEEDIPVYLTNTGMVKERRIFSPIFDEYVKNKTITKKQQTNAVEFTRKEHALFNLLKEHVNNICEREQIIEKVWPESEEYGISDWSVDKLMERLRDKIKKQRLPYQVITVRTRGYKLINI